MKILIVEDDHLCAECVRELLNPYCTKIHYAATISDAFKYLQQCQFDLIVLDLRLEDSTADNTIDCIGEIRALQFSAGILIMSGMHPQEYFRERSIKSGADVFIAKGANFSRNALYLAVAAAVRQRHNHATPSDTEDRIMQNVELMEKIAATP